MIANCSLNYADYSDTIQLAAQLIKCPSITPDDAGCQDLLAARLVPLDFKIERLRFGVVDNLWARRGTEKPLLVFAGHTDVVPTGPIEQWHVPPFDAVIKDSYLYGRGAADMKGSIAAMITACERFIKQHPAHRGSIGFLITSDEEGPSIDGTAKVIECLQARYESIDFCLIGEPTSLEQVGDSIKNGRRGSLNGTLLIKGKQGHAAYPQRVRNPIHALGPIIVALTQECWNHGNAFFPPTSFQISNIHAGTGALNVIPGEAHMLFNFRFSTAVTTEQLKQRTQQLIETCLVNEEIRHQQVFGYDLQWNVSGLPFLTESGELVIATCAAITEETGLTTQLSTGGGTSDGRFIAPTGAQVVELGPLNATIHQINERVSVTELDVLSRIYERILIRLLVNEPIVS